MPIGVQVVNLISSSPDPRPPPKNLPTKQSSLAARRTASSTDSRSLRDDQRFKRPLDKTPDLLLLSDGPPSDIIIPASATPPRETAPKRRRLSPRPPSPVRLVSGSETAAARSQHQKVSFNSRSDLGFRFGVGSTFCRAKTWTDTIDLSSDFEVPASKPATHISVGSESDDPFASSPFPALSKPSEIRAAIGCNTRRPLSTACESKRQVADHISSDPFAPSPPRKAPSAAPARRDWDPISSSAPEMIAHAPPAADLQPRGDTISIGSSDVESSGSLSNELPDLDRLAGFKPRIRRAPARHNSDDGIGASTSKGTTAASKSIPEADKRGAKAAPATKKGPSKSKEAREVDRERKRQEELRAKEETAREKQRAAALAEVNKVKTDKKISTKEMMVMLPDSFDTSFALQVETLLDGVDAEHQAWTSPMECVVKWRRKVVADYDYERRHWVPAPLRIEDEKYALVVMKAEEFVERALDTGERNITAHGRRLAELFPGHKLMYLLEGVAPWMRKNRNIRNRQFTSAVRGQPAAGDNNNDEAASQPSNCRKRAPARQYISEEAVEDALIQLQVQNSVLIHHTNAPAETAQWIMVFTQHISTARYRHKQDELAAADGSRVCMDAGQVRSGEDKHDTYVRLLQEITRVTAPIAYGIAAALKSPTELVEALVKGGPLVLENVKRCANRDGVATDRTIGQAVSRRIYKVFTGMDESSTDI